MPKPLKKDTFIKVYLNSDEKKQVETLVAISGKKSMSEFILAEILNNSLRRPSSNDDAFRDLTIVLRKKFNDIESFQHQQKITMYIIMQFIMFLASSTQSRDTIMEFYDDAYKGAIEKFGKEE